MHSLVYDIMSDAQRKVFEKTSRSTSRSRSQPRPLPRQCAVQSRTAVPPRCSVPFRRACSLEDLATPKIFAELALKPRGLVLVTGPTGSGKSTTLAAMVNHANENIMGHILTVEGPDRVRARSKNA